MKGAGWRSLNHFGSCSVYDAPRRMVALDNTLPRAVAFTAPPDAPPEEKRQGRLSAACQNLFKYQEFLERAKGFEPSTPTLARSCSTTELHPHPRDWRRSLAGNGQSYAKCAPRMQQSARSLESAG
jgi:hypothetical protein